MASRLLRRLPHGLTMLQVKWLQGFYRLPGHTKVAGSSAYKDGHIYGIDASSGAAVAALDPQPGEHILELCSAPGRKYGSEKLMEASPLSILA